MLLLDEERHASLADGFLERIASHVDVNGCECDIKLETSLDIFGVPREVSGLLLISLSLQ